MAVPVFGMTLVGVGFSEGTSLIILPLRASYLLPFSSIVEVLFPNAGALTLFRFLVLIQ